MQPLSSQPGQQVTYHMHPFVIHYNQVVVPKLKEARQYPSSYVIPHIEKVSINCGVGDLLGNDKAIEDVATMLSAITGQKAVTTKSRKAIAGFKIRQNVTVGLKVTLRGTRMHDFLSKLTQVTLPRTRDFRGLKASSVTSDGNLNIGIKDSMIFPESNQDGLSHSLQVTLVSNATSKEEAHLLYESLGFVFGGEETLVKKKKSRSYTKKK